jgi:hypothetical protein
MHSSLKRSLLAASVASLVAVAPTSAQIRCTDRQNWSEWHPIVDGRMNGVDVAFKRGDGLSYGTTKQGTECYFRLRNRYKDAVKIDIEFQNTNSDGRPAPESYYVELQPGQEKASPGYVFDVISINSVRAKTIRFQGEELATQMNAQRDRADANRGNIDHARIELSELEAHVRNANGSDATTRAAISRAHTRAGQIGSELVAAAGRASDPGAADQIATIRREISDARAVFDADLARAPRASESSATSQTRSADPDRDAARARDEEQARAEARRRKDAAATSEALGDFASSAANAHVGEGVLMGDANFNLGLAFFDTKSSVDNNGAGGAMALTGTIRRFFNVEETSKRIEIGANGGWLTGSSTFLGSVSDMLQNLGKEPSQQTSSGASEAGVDLELYTAQPYAQFWFSGLGLGATYDWRKYQLKSQTRADLAVEDARAAFLPMLSIGSMTEKDAYWIISAYGMPASETTKIATWGANLQFAVGLLQVNFGYASRNVGSRNAPIQSDWQVLFSGGLRMR